jgi:hypothetical protein
MDEIRFRYWAEAFDAQMNAYGRSAVESGLALAGETFEIVPVLRAAPRRA